MDFTTVSGHLLHGVIQPSAAQLPPQMCSLFNKTCSMRIILTLVDCVRSAVVYEWLYKMSDCSNWVLSLLQKYLCFLFHRIWLRMWIMSTQGFTITMIFEGQIVTHPWTCRLTKHFALYRGVAASTAGTAMTIQVFGKPGFYSGRGSFKVIVLLLSPCLLAKFPCQRSASHRRKQQSPFSTNTLLYSARGQLTWAWFPRVDVVRSKGD